MNSEGILPLEYLSEHLRPSYRAEAILKNAEQFAEHYIRKAGTTNPHLPIVFASSARLVQNIVVLEKTLPLGRMNGMGVFPWQYGQSKQTNAPAHPQHAPSTRTRTHTHTPAEMVDCR